MSKGERWDVALALGKGLGAAVLITLVGMALLAAAVVWMPISDGALLALNQVLKIASIFCGAMVAVGLGGRRGFAVGAVVGVLYMVLGYGLYCLLDRAMAPTALLVGEFGLGAAIGALSGAVAANLKPRRRRARAH